MATLACAQVSTIGAKSRKLPPEPTSDQIVILSNGKAFGIRELNQAAQKHLADAGEVLDGSRIQVLVRVTPDDAETICKILYVQGFEQPVWTVSFGYDGKVKSHSKNIKREEGFGHLPK